MQGFERQPTSDADTAQQAKVIFSNHEVNRWFSGKKTALSIGQLVIEVR